ncbi:MAG: hypothetical protein V4612_00880 [Pseudomonadota bacterium]
MKKTLEEILNKTIESLNGSDDERGKKVKAFIEDLEANNKTLISLNLWHNAIDNNEAIALAKALETNKTLTSLSLAFSEIGDKGAMAFAKALETNETLTSLILGFSKIGDEGARAVAKALETNKTLTSLSLEHNQIGDEGAQALAEALKTNTTITNLYLDKNHITDEGFIKILVAVVENLESHIKISFSDPLHQEVFDKLMRIKAENLIALEHQDPHKLSSDQVVLIFNQIKAERLEVEISSRIKVITHDGVCRLRAYHLLDPYGYKKVLKNIAKILQPNTTLTSLDLTRNEIGNEEVIAFVETLKTNTVLTQLWLSENKIGDEGVIALADALETNTTLTSLGLSDNEIGDEGVIALAEALEKNTTLTYLGLGLSKNEIGYEGAKALAKALKTNTTLTKLNLDGNKLGDAGFIAIFVAVVANLKSHIEISFGNLFHREVFNEFMKIKAENLIAWEQQYPHKSPGDLVVLIFNQIKTEELTDIAKGLIEKVKLELTLSKSPEPQTATESPLPFQPKTDQQPSLKLTDITKDQIRVILPNEVLFSENPDEVLLSAVSDDGGGNGYVVSIRDNKNRNIRGVANVAGHQSEEGFARLKTEFLKIDGNPLDCTVVFFGGSPELNSYRDYYEMMADKLETLFPDASLKYQGPGTNNVLIISGGNKTMIGDGRQNICNLSYQDILAGKHLDESEKKKIELRSRVCERQFDLKTPEESLNLATNYEMQETATNPAETAKNQLLEEFYHEITNEMSGDEVVEVLKRYPNLKSLTLPDMPNLKTLDLSSMPNLEFINLSSCKNLISLNLSNMPELLYVKIPDYLVSLTLIDLPKASLSSNESSNETRVKYLTLGGRLKENEKMLNDFPLIKTIAVHAGCKVFGFEAKNDDDYDYDWKSRKNTKHKIQCLLSDSQSSAVVTISPPPPSIHPKESSSLSSDSKSPEEKGHG